MSTTEAAPAALTIADVAAATGLSRDTLRWYEREGLLPRVDRGGDRRRRYSERHLGLLQVLVRLRRTGMPVSEVRRFSHLMAGGAATHGVRAALLLAHRQRVAEHIARLQEDLTALDAKVEHYRGLIAAGLDCDGTSVDAATAALQRDTTTALQRDTADPEVP